MIKRVIFCDCNDRTLKKQAKRIRDKDKGVICSGGGYSNNFVLGTNLLTYKQRDYTIITNDTQFLDNMYCWNEEEKKCELYFLNVDTFNSYIHWCGDLTEREIRKTHNLRNLYIKGEFKINE